MNFVAARALNTFTLAFVMHSVNTLYENKNHSYMKNWFDCSSYSSALSSHKPVSYNIQTTER